MTEYGYTGKINNWMDFRDLLIETLNKCDTELKFEKILTGIFLSISVSPEGLQETRKSLGLKEYTKEEMKSIKKMFEEEKF